MEEAAAAFSLLSMGIVILLTMLFPGNINADAVTELLTEEAVRTTMV